MTIYEINNFEIMMERNYRLLNLCLGHNSANQSNPELLIDLYKYKTAEDLIFNLWYHNIDVGNLGFGEPYDEIIKDWVPDNYDQPFEENAAYLTYVNAEKIPWFLSYSLVLPKNYNEQWNRSQKFSNSSKILKIFNKFWMNLGKEPISDYNDFVKILISNTLTKIELCCLLWECQNYRLFNSNMSVDDFLNDII